MRLAESDGKGGTEGEARPVKNLFTHTLAHTDTHRLADTHVDCGFHLSQINENAAGKSSLHALSEQSTLPSFLCHSPLYFSSLSTLPSLSSGLWAKSFWPLLEFWWANWKFHLGFLRWRFLLAIFSSLHFSELFVYLSVCSASTRKWQLITCHGRRRRHRRRRRRCSIDAL